MRQFPRYILKKYLGPRGRGGTSGYKPRCDAWAAMTLVFGECAFPPVSLGPAGDCPCKD